MDKYHTSNATREKINDEAGTEDPLPSCTEKHMPRFTNSEMMLPSLHHGPRLVSKQRLEDSAHGEERGWVPRVAQGEDWAFTCPCLI